MYVIKICSLLAAVTLFQCAFAWQSNHFSLPQYETLPSGDWDMSDRSLKANTYQFFPALAHMMIEKDGSTEYGAGVSNGVYNGANDTNRLSLVSQYFLSDIAEFFRENITFYGIEKPHYDEGRRYEGYPGFLGFSNSDDLRIVTGPGYPYMSNMLTVGCGGWGLGHYDTTYTSPIMRTAKAYYDLIFGGNLNLIGGGKDELLSVILGNDLAISIIIPITGSFLRLTEVNGWNKLASYMNDKARYKWFAYANNEGCGIVGTNTTYKFTSNSSIICSLGSTDRTIKFTIGSISSTTECDSVFEEQWCANDGFSIHVEERINTDSAIASGLITMSAIEINPYAHQLFECKIDDVDYKAGLCSWGIVSGAGTYPISIEYTNRYYEPGTMSAYDYYANGGTGSFEVTNNLSMYCATNYKAHVFSHYLFPGYGDYLFSYDIPSDESALSLKTFVNRILELDYNGIFGSEKHHPHFLNHFPGSEESEYTISVNHPTTYQLFLEDVEGRYVNAGYSTNLTEVISEPPSALYIPFSMSPEVDLDGAEERTFWCGDTKTKFRMMFSVDTKTKVLNK